MKKLIIIFFSFILFSSCEKLLEEKPESIAAEVFYNTAKEVEAGLNAIYTPVRGTGTIGALYPCQLEIYTEYLYGRGSHAPLNEYQGLDNTNITRIGDMWRAFYQSIRNANIVISRVKLAAAISDADKIKYEAEAKYLRALWYFHLVRNWAGVPIRTENNMDSIDVKRSSADEVYQLIVSDLVFAEANLPETPRLIGTPSNYAAKTVLADVYMHLGDFNAARNKANEVIQSNKFALVNVSVPEDFEKIFGPEVVNSTEEIFYIKYSRTPPGQNFAYPQYTHYPGSGYYPPGGFYTFYSDSEANPFIKNWDKNDLRYSFNWYSQTFGLGPNTILNKKFSDKTTTTGGGNDFPMYRYADLLLFYAESEARASNGPTADAVEKLNMVRRRAYGKTPLLPNADVDYKLSDFSDLDSFIDIVVKERGYENVAEGKRWFDLKRLGIAEEVIQSVEGKAMHEKHLLWPIPTIEYNYNKAINPASDQNPGY
jgi:hypothetical protein